MRRAGLLGGALLAAGLIAVGVVHTVGDSDAPKPSQSSIDHASAKEPDATAREQRAQLRKAMAEVQRGLIEYAKKHPPVQP